MRGVVLVTLVALVLATVVVSDAAVMRRRSSRNAAPSVTNNAQDKNGSAMKCGKLKTAMIDGKPTPCSGLSAEDQKKHCKCDDPNMCCSAFHFCGQEEFHCSERWGCQSSFGRCTDRNGTSLADKTEKKKEAAPAAEKKPENKPATPPPTTPATPVKTKKAPTPEQIKDSTAGDKSLESKPRVVVKTISVACPTCKLDELAKLQTNGAPPNTTAPAASKSTTGTPNAVDEGPPKQDCPPSAGIVISPPPSTTGNCKLANAVNGVVAAANVAAAQAVAQNAANAAANQLKQAQLQANLQAVSKMQVPVQSDAHRQAGLLEPSGY